MTIVPRQADALSIYDPDAASPDTSEEKIEKPLEQDDYTTTKTNCKLCYGHNRKPSILLIVSWRKVIIG
jgi:hypothetical protein